VDDIVLMSAATAYVRHDSVSPPGLFVKPKPSH
jgi:hypothetical protein